MSGLSFKSRFNRSCFGQLKNNYLPLHVFDASIVAIPTLLAFWVSRKSKEVGIPNVNEQGIDVVDPGVAVVEAEAGLGQMHRRFVVASATRLGCQFPEGGGVCG